MFATIVSLILGLISAFAAKKKGGANNTQAALVGAAAAAGTYYVATQTEFGQSAISSLEGVFTPAKDVQQVEQVMPDGTKVMVTPSAAETTTAGNTVKVTTPVAAGGNGFATTLTTSTADVLKSWGATGTAAVIGTTAVASSSTLSKYLPWLLGGALLLLLTR